LADQKISQLSTHTLPAGEDLLLVVDDPSGSPINKKLPLSTLFGKVAANTVINGTFTANTNSIRISNALTPANSTATSVAGSISWDANYLYITTAANTIKRVALTAF
jgi:hypothetical protein